MRIDAQSAAIPVRASAAARPARTDATDATAGVMPARGLSGAAATRAVKAENRQAALDPAAVHERADQVAALMAGRPRLDVRM